MSGQRYPANDPRYGRERSPSRPLERFSSNPSYPSRSNTFDQRTDPPSGPNFSREAPRGPKALVDPPRGPEAGAPTPFAPRGRGGFARGNFRGDFRDRETRDPPRSPSWTADRDRAWRERDSDRRERRPSPPRARASQNDVRDFRDPPARDADADRAFRGIRDGLNSTQPPALDARDASQPLGRGGYSRGRGRGDWDPRGRARGSLADDRPRSPPRDPYWTRDTFRDDRDVERRDDRQPGRRDSDKVSERDDRERDSERFRRESYPLGADARRTSAPPTPPMNSASGQPAGPNKMFTAERPSLDADRDRRLSGFGGPPPTKDLRRGSFQSEPGAPRVEAAREGISKRPSSPPQAPQVPQFGSLPTVKPASEPQPWNVWRAASDTKPPQQASPPTNPAVLASKVPPTAPTAPKSELERMPPKGPKADRVDSFENRDQAFARNVQMGGVEGLPPGRPRTPPHLQHPVRTMEAAESTVGRSAISPRTTAARPFFQTNPPTGPSALNQGGYRPQPAAPAAIPGPPAPFSAPSGPRGGLPPTSPRTGSAVIPTGPKAERSQFAPPRGPAAAQATGPWPWQRQGPHLNATKAGQLIPSKRDFSGDTKREVIPRPSALPPHESTSPRSAENFGEKFDGLQSRTMLGTQESPKRTAVPLDHFVEEEDPMDLDEGDFADNETKFQREKAILESRLTDLNSRELRGTTPLEQLSLLTCLVGRDAVSQQDSVVETEAEAEADAETEAQELKAIHGEMLTPSIEDREDSAMVDLPARPRRPSTPPISTPEVLKLPFLNQGPPTPLSEIEILQENREKHELNREIMLSEISRRLEYRQKTEDSLREEYARLYKPWKRYTNELDKQNEEEERKMMPTAEPDPQAAAPDPTAAARLPTASEGRRGHKFASEYEIQKAIEESEKMFQDMQAKQEREALHAKPDLKREAIVPDILEESARRNWPVKDTSRLRDPALAYQVFELVPPVDDFSPREHDVLLQHFRDYPKKWGKLAQALPGRTYKECINHYYATKWTGEYKPLKDKRRRRNNGKPGRGSGKPRSLMSNLEIPPDVYQGDEFGQTTMAMTDSGRPRRAAAPTFGEKETDADTPQSGTPARRNGANKGDSASDANAEKTVKRRGVNKERSQRKVKNASVSAISGMSPAKQDPDPRQRYANEDELKTRELDVVNGLASMHNGQVMAWPGEGVGYQEMRGPGGDDGMDLGHGSQSSRPTPVSYWSVREVNRFPAYLAHFGTDWHRLSAHMGTKSANMVRNYYIRSIEKGRKDMEDVANEADARIKRGEETAPPPSPGLSTRPRRPENAAPTAPRQLAPNTEGMEVYDETGTPLQTSRVPVPYIGYPTTSQPPQPQRISAAGQPSAPDFNGIQQRDPQPQRVFGQEPGFQQRQTHTQQALQTPQYYQPHENQVRHQGERPQEQQWQGSNRPPMIQTAAQSSAPYGQSQPVSAQPHRPRSYDADARSPTASSFARYGLAADGHQDGRPPPYIRAADQPQASQSSQYWPNRQNQPQHGPGPTYNAAPLHHSPQSREEPRPASFPSHSNVAPPPPRPAEQRKVNILDLLNNDTDDAKPESTSQTSNSSARPPSPHSMYQSGIGAPNRPASNPPPGPMYSDPSRHRPYEAQPQTSRQPAQEYSRPEYQRTSSADWPPQNRASHLPPTSNPGAGPSMYDHSREVKPSYGDRGPPQPAQIRHSQPQPSHGPQYAHSRDTSFSDSRHSSAQQQQQPPSSQPQQILQQNPYSQGAGQPGSRHQTTQQQNQAAHTHNNSLGSYPEHSGRPRQSSDHALSRPPGAPEPPDFGARQREEQQQQARRDWEHSQMMMRQQQQQQQPQSYRQQRPMGPHEGEAERRTLFGAPRTATPPQPGRSLFGDHRGPPPQQGR